jgi:ribose-phosphate pyrophosphokinase
MPFFGYARQDRKDQPRVPITAKLVANLLTAAGVHRVLTMDLHASQIQGFFDIPVDHLYAKPALVGYLRERHLDTANLCVVSPDVGGVKMARSYAEALGAELAIVAKHRINATQVEAMNVIGEVKGRSVLLVDDMTETAGTLCAAADLLQREGAGRIFAGVSHAVIGEVAQQRLRESAIEEVITTDSVPQAVGEKIHAVSVAPLLGQAIARISKCQSVTSLFEV